LYLNAEEQQAVDTDIILFLLGRAGAGKTAVVQGRALQSQRRWRDMRALSSEDEAPRTASALVLTMSPRLCLHLAKEYSKVWSAEEDDGVAGATSLNGEEPGLMDDAAQQRALDALPAHFRDIDDIISKTPTLIITTSKFLSMLDITLPAPFLTAERENNDVTYERFVEEYWPSIKRLVKEDSETPVLVFKEIISVIKGNPRVLKQNDGKPMSREKYETASDMRDSCFLHDLSARTRVYTAFEEYEKLRRRNPRDYDIVDIVRDLLKRIKTHGYKGLRFESLLIDEAQDVLPCIFLLLQHVCPNIHQWTIAADTAQTIGRLAHWRFATVRSFIHDHLMQPEERRTGVPDIMPLTQNYRSVRGVLELAASVIDALVRYFPDHVDELPRERALVDTESRPIFTSSVPLETAMRLLSGESRSDGQPQVLEFGAHQALIVRRDKDKQRLKAQFPTSLVLTPYDAKGQEFNDVIVVDFFDSTIEDGGKGVWRFLPMISHKEGRSFFGGYSLRGRDDFDPAKHAILNEYLKELYVVITRAKKRLIFFDKPGAESCAVEAYWRSLQLIQACDTEAELEQAFKNFGRLVQDSTAEEWLEQGKTLFNDSKFEDASLCFRRAQEIALAEFAQAEGLCHSAKALRDAEKRKPVMLEASKIYCSLAQSRFSCKSEEAKRLLPAPSELAIKEGHCLVMASEFDKAARVFDTQSAFKEAGEAWEKARNVGKAAISYKNARMWDRSAQCFQEDEKWTQAAQCWMEASAFEKAGDCFKKSNDWPQAAEAYQRATKWLQAGRCWEKLDDYKKALRAYLRGPCWPEAAHMHEKLEEWESAAFAWRKGKQFKSEGKAWEQAGITGKAFTAYLDSWTNGAYKLGLVLGEKLRSTSARSKQPDVEVTDFALGVLSQFLAKNPTWSQRVPLELPIDTQQVLSKCASVLFKVDQSMTLMTQLGLGALTHDALVQKGVFRQPAVVELGQCIYPGLFSESTRAQPRIVLKDQMQDISSRAKPLLEKAAEQCRSPSVKSPVPTGLLGSYKMLLTILDYLVWLDPPSKCAAPRDLSKKMQPLVDFVCRPGSDNAQAAVQTVAGIILLDLCATLVTDANRWLYSTRTKKGKAALEKATFLNAEVLEAYCSKSECVVHLHQDPRGHILFEGSLGQPKRLVKWDEDEPFPLQTIADVTNKAALEEKPAIEIDLLAITEQELSHHHAVVIAARQAGTAVWRKCEQAINSAITDLRGLTSNIWDWLPSRTESLLQELLLAWNKTPDDPNARYAILQQQVFNHKFPPRKDHSPDQFAAVALTVLQGALRSGMQQIAWSLKQPVQGAWASEKAPKFYLNLKADDALYSQWFAHCSPMTRKQWQDVQKSLRDIHKYQGQAVTRLQCVIEKHAEGPQGPAPDNFERKRRTKVLDALCAVREVGFTSLSAFRTIATSPNARADQLEAVCDALSTAMEACEKALVD